MDPDALMYLGLCGLLALLVMISSGTYGFLSLPVLVLGLVTLMLLFLIEFADFLVFPFFTNVTGIKLIPAKNYYIPRTQNAVVKLTNGLYYATGYLSGNLFSYIFKAEEVKDEETELGNAMDKWERIVMNVNFPFKFNIVSMAQDVQKYRDALEGERGFYQFQMSREMQNSSQNPVVLQEIQSKINIVEAKMDRVGGGEKPVNSIIYIESTAVGVSEKEALDLLDGQLNQLQTVFNAFDLSIMRITGREVYFLYKFNYRLPDIPTLMSMFQGQK
jgi:hypothetical protein